VVAFVALDGARRENEGRSYFMLARALGTRAIHVYTRFACTIAMGNVATSRRSGLTG
jgi:hypothetical protein